MKGYVERLIPSEAAGWAWDPQNPHDAMELEATLDGKVIARGTAAAFRADLQKAGIGDGRHSFLIRFAQPLQANDLPRVTIRRAADGSELEPLGALRERLRSLGGGPVASENRAPAVMAGAAPAGQGAASTVDTTPMGLFRRGFATAAAEARAGIMRDLVFGEMNPALRFQRIDAAYTIDPRTVIACLAQAAKDHAPRAEIGRFLVWHYLRAGDFAAARTLCLRLAQAVQPEAEWHAFAIRAALLGTPHDAREGWLASGARTGGALRKLSYRTLAAVAAADGNKAELVTMWLDKVRDHTRAEFEAARAADPAVGAFLDEVSAMQSVALVGNGPSLARSGLGRRIDGFDGVFRVNFPIIGELAPDVGTRTDAVFFTETLFMGHGINRLLDANGAYRSVRALSFEGSTGGVAIHDAAAHMAEAGASTYVRLPVRIRNLLVQMSYDGHTTGFVTLMFLAILLGKKVTVFGFDFYRQGTHNYWTVGVPQPPLHHELQFERFYVERFLVEHLAVELGAG
jgi:hypothetical protein